MPVPPPPPPFPHRPEAHGPPRPGALPTRRDAAERARAHAAGGAAAGRDRGPHLWDHRHRKGAHGGHQGALWWPGRGGARRLAAAASRGGGRSIGHRLAAGMPQAMACTHASMHASTHPPHACAGARVCTDPRVLCLLLLGRRTSRACLRVRTEASCMWTRSTCWTTVSLLRVLCLRWVCCAFLVQSCAWTRSASWTAARAWLAGWLLAGSMGGTAAARCPGYCCSSPLPRLLLQQPAAWSGASAASPGLRGRQAPPHGVDSRRRLIRPFRLKPAALLFRLTPWAGLVDVVLDSAAGGTNTVEREGISIVHPAKFIMIGECPPLLPPLLPPRPSSP
jgi:hypothetical protein